MTRCMRVWSIAALTSFLAACGGGGDGGQGPPPPPPQPTLGSITATPSTIGSLSIGATATISVQALDTQGNPISGATGFIFTSQNPAIASVSALGVVQGVAAGSATITVSLTLAGVTRTATVAVTVVGPVLGSITATPSTISTLNIGGTATISVQALDAQGNPITGATGFVFTSQNPAIASVSAQGVVQGVAAGSTTITVSLTLAGVTRTATVAVTVVAQTLGSIAATPATIGSLSIGATAAISVQALDTQGNPISGATGFVFTSQSVAIASVTAQGVVQGVAAGSTSITISLTLSGVTRTTTVSVTVVAAGFPTTATVTATTLNTFDPGSVDIARTGSVTWVFESVVHNVIFAGTTGAPANINDSSNTSLSRTFNTAGNFSYQCTIHAGMNGTVIVH